MDYDIRIGRRASILVILILNYAPKKILMSNAQNPYDIPLHRLINRDPCNGLFIIPI